MSYKAPKVVNHHYLFSLSSLDKPAYTEDDEIRVSLLVAKKREGVGEGPGGGGGSSNNGRAQAPGTGIKRITIQGLQQVSCVIIF